MFVPAICPQCNGKIKVDCDNEAAVCEFCGMPFVVDKAINIYRTSIVNNNNFAGATVNIQFGNKDNFLTLAKNAESVGNNEEALQYYTKVLELQPNNCEALIGKGVSTLYCSKLDDIKSDELLGYATKAINSKKEEYGTSDEEVDEFIFQTALKLYNCAVAVFGAAKNHYQEVWKYDGAALNYWNHLSSAQQIFYCVTISTEPPKKSNTQDGVNLYLESLKFTIECCIEACKQRRYVTGIEGQGEFIEAEIYGDVKLSRESHNNWLEIYDLALEKIKSIQPSYQPNEEINRKLEIKKSGCYIATCVYETYDCPEVWVLRRFRDFKLMQDFWGRLFVKIYYAISPTVVLIFGKQTIFKRFWKKILDIVVAKLKAKGFEDTNYYGN